MATKKKKRGGSGARTKKCSAQWKKKSDKFRKSHKWTAFLKGGKGRCSVPKAKKK